MSNLDAKILFYPHDWKRPAFGDHYHHGTTNEDGTFEAGWGNATGVKFFRIIVSKPGYVEEIRIVVADEKDIRVVLSIASQDTE